MYDIDGNELARETIATNVEIIGGLAYGDDGAGNVVYLIVYSKNNESGVYGQFIDQSGASYNEFTISSTGRIFGGGNTAVYDPSSLTSRFLVAYTDNHNGHCQTTVKAKYVFVGNSVGSEIIIDNDNICNDNPVAVETDGSGHFLVAWSDEVAPATNNWDLYGRIIDSNGSPGNTITIANAVRGQFVPFIVYNPDAGKYLVSWNDERSSPGWQCDPTAGTCFDIYGRFVNQDGSLEPEFKILKKAGNQIGGIAGYDSTNGVYFGLANYFANNFSSSKDVYGLFLTEFDFKVTFPNGGEVIKSGSQTAITWDEIALPGITYTIKYSLDNGTTWKTIATGVTGSSLTWDVPVPLNNKTKCLIKVSAINANGQLIASDRSDAPFTIEVVKLNTPNGGESLISGSSYDITWSTNTTKNPVSKVILQYTLDGGLTWKQITTFTGGNNPGTYTWQVPTVISTKTKCKVKVVLKDSAGNVVGSDLSDGFFTINP
jgi:hypothetical protein